MFIPPGELRARLGMVRRIVELQADLATQVLALEDALQRENLLQTRVSLLRPSLHKAAAAAARPGGRQNQRVTY